MNGACLDGKKRKVDMVVITITITVKLPKYQGHIINIYNHTTK